MGNLEASAWSGTLGRSSFRAKVTSSNPEAVSSPANGTSDKSRGGLLMGQCDFKEVLGRARKRLGALDEEAGGFFRQQGALVSGVPVWLGLPGRSGMGHCPRYQPICAENIKPFLR